MSFYATVYVYLVTTVLQFSHYTGVWEKNFETASSLPTSDLAKLVVRQYHLGDEDVALYTRHVALLVSGITILTY